ncbi:MAG: hypothetical protein HFE49_07925 [Clostridia bacterium]|nr:hypothetical protein [Clostridia bacterium]
MKFLGKIQKIRKRMISSVLAAAMLTVLMPMLPVVPETTASAEPALNIKLGEYIKMGTYNGQDILWRCVGFQAISGSRVAENDFVTAPTSGYVPLMYADTSLCRKAFDAKGTAGTHSRYSYRERFGSSYWDKSTLRAWLNSSAGAGSVVWPETVPNSSNVSLNPYDSEAGFMNSFKPNEKTFIKSVSQKELLSQYDSADKTTGTAYHTHNPLISDILQNYTTAYAKNTTDSIFLPDVRQIKAVYDNRSTLGEDYYKPQDNSSCWLRSPKAEYGSDVRHVDTNGNVNNNIANYGNGGVRPAFFLDQSSAVVFSGSGTAGSPYEIYKEPTLTVSNKTMTYGDSASALSVSTNSSGARSYSSSNEAVAKVSSDGKVTAVKPGSATITVNLAADMTNKYASKTATCTVRVNKATPALTAPTAKSLTYTGATQVLINGGTTSSGCTMQYKVNNGSWMSTVPSETNAGTYTVYYQVIGNDYYNNRSGGSISVKINPANPLVNAPTGQNLTYNGKAQNLVIAGSTTGGTLQYKLGSNGTYSTNIPTATAVGTYTVYYKVVGNSNYNSVGEKSVTATIGATAATLTSRPAAIQNLVYNGQSRNLVTAGTASGGTLMYRVGNSGNYSSTVPKATNAGKYVVWYYVKGDSNHGDTTAESVEVTIGKANSSITKAPTAKTGLVTTGSAQALVTAGTSTGGTMEYSLTGVGNDWSTTIPTATIGGEYTVYYRVAENTNYNGLTGGNVKVTIGNSPSEITANTKTVTYGDTISISVNVRKTGISTFAATNQAEFYLVEGQTYLANADVVYDSTGINGTATINNVKVDKGRFHIGENRVRVVYGGGPSLGNSEVANIIIKVEPKEVGLTWAGNAARTYNGVASNVTATATKLETGDTVNVTVTGGDAVDADTHTATATELTGADAGYYKLPAANTKSYIINKANSEVTTAPTALTGLVCNDAPQALVNAGTAAGGTLMYKIGDGEYSEDIPKATNVGTYTVWYYVKGDANHIDTQPVSIEVTIGAGIAGVGIAPAPIANLVYNGDPQEIITAGAGENGRTMKYAALTAAELNALRGQMPADEKYVEEIPKYTDAGTYTVYYMVAGDANVTDLKIETPITATIVKADIEIKSNVIHVNYNDELKFKATVTKKLGSISAFAGRETVDFYIVKGNNKNLIANKSVEFSDFGVGLEGEVAFNNVKVTRDKFAPGENTLVAEYGGSVNVNEGGSNTITVIVDPLPVDITWSGYATREYDRTASNVTATAGGLIDDGLGNYDDVQVVVSNGNQTAAGEHTARITGLAGAHAGYYKLPDDESVLTQDYVIEKADSVLTANPTANELTYNGGEQQLVQAGSAENGTVMYKVVSDDEPEATTDPEATTTPEATAQPEPTPDPYDGYSEEIPRGMNAGKYTVYYKVFGDVNYNDVAEQSIPVTIEKANPEVIDPTAKVLTYNGHAQELVHEGLTSGGTMMYKLDNGEYSEDIPTATAAGTYKVSYMVKGNNNYNDTAAGEVSITIAKADSQVTADGAINITYNSTLELNATVSINNTGLQTFALENQIEFVGMYGMLGGANVIYNDDHTGGTATLRNIPVSRYNFAPGRNEITARYGGGISINGSDDNKIIVNVEPIVLDLDWSNIEERDYDGTASNVTASIASVYVPGDNVQVVVEEGNATDAGTHTAVARLEGAQAAYYKLSEATATQDYVINKIDAEITTLPSANELTYNGNSQALITAGEVSNGTLFYKVGEDGNYSDLPPQATEAGEYTVYYKINGGTNYKDTEDTAIPVTIAQADPEVTAPTAKTLVYNGQAQTLLNEGSTSGGTLMYKLGNGEYSEDIPTAAASGNYKVYYKVEGDNNYAGVDEQEIDVTIAKADSQVTAGAIDVQYNDTLNLTANVSLKDSGISAFALKDTVQFYIGENQDNLDVADVVYTDETNTEGTATISVKVSRNRGFVPGANIITAQYGGDGVSINGSNDNTIIVNVTPIQLDINWSGYDTRAYDGTESEVTAEISGVLNTDKNDVSVEVEGGDAANAGEHTATATLTGEYAGYYTLPEDASEQTYVIEKANPEYTVPIGVTAEYGLSLSSVRLPEGWSWEDDSQDVGEIGEHTFKAVYTPEDTDNYNVISDIDVVVSVISGNDYTITNIANAEEDGFVDVSVIKNTQANGVLIVSSYSSEGILIGVKAVDINGITGETPENDTIKVELTCEDGGYISAFVWSALDSMTPMSGKFIK